MKVTIKKTVKVGDTESTNEIIFEGNGEEHHLLEVMTQRYYNQMIYPDQVSVDQEFINQAVIYEGNDFE